MRIAPNVIVTDEDRRALERWARGRSAPVRRMQRAKIVLLAAEGQENQAIAAAVGVTRQLVGRWRRRYVARGLAEDRLIGTCMPRHRPQEWLKFLRQDRTGKDRPE
jgi:transposase